MADESSDSDEEDEELFQDAVDVNNIVMEYLEEEDEIGGEGIKILNKDSDEDNCNRDKPTTFDTSLPTFHSYMGDDMEELHGRTVHGDGDLVVLPLFYQPGVVLSPGQILPLNLFHPQPISMMKKVITADKTFGLMIARSNREDVEGRFASVGVTCEIFSVKEDIEYGIVQMSIKAEGRQRFKILSKTLQVDGVMMGKIKILPDAYISPHPHSALLYSQLHHPNAIRSQILANRYHQTKPWNFNESRYLAGFHKPTLLCTSFSSLQAWIYKLYNPYFLMDCLINEIRSWNQNLEFHSLPTNPVEFSHWITANLPLTNDMKIELLEMDSASLRLRRQIEIMSKCATTLACHNCGVVIADKNDLFSLSKTGPMAAYVNPGGHVHETVTFYKATNLSLSRKASTEYSWFPGYAWTIASCNECRSHMGWKFTAAKKGLNPHEFWGLTRAALQPVYKEEPCESIIPIEPTTPTDERPVDAERDHVRSAETMNPIQYESNI